jgi:hypothetical protein
MSNQVFHVSKLSVIYWSDVHNRRLDTGTNANLPHGYLPHAALAPVQPAIDD